MNTSSMWITFYKIRFLFLFLSFRQAQSFKDLFCPVDILSPSIRIAYDVILVQQSGQDGAFCQRRNAILTKISMHKEVPDLSKYKLKDFNVFLIIYANDMREVVDLLFKTSDGRREWTTFILVDQPIKEAELSSYIQNSTQRSLGPAFNMLSLTFIVEYTNETINDPDADLMPIRVIEVFSIRGELQLVEQEAEMPFHLRWLSAVHSRRHFGRLPLRVVAMPYNLVNRGARRDLMDVVINREQKPVIAGGYEKQIITFLAAIMNFTTVLSLGAGYTGTMQLSSNPNRTLKSLSAHIEDDEAELAMTSTELIPERVKRFAFVVPTYESSVFAYIKKQPSNLYRNVYLKTFQLSIWGLILLTWVLVGSAVIGFGWFWKRMKGYSRETSEQRLENEALIWAVGTACQEGWDFTPVWIPMRILVLAGHYFGLLCFVAFGAALVSILSSHAELINNTDDLREYGYQFFSEVGTVSSTMVLKSLDLLDPEAVVPPSKEIEYTDFVQSPPEMLSAFLSVPDNFYSYLKLFKKDLNPLKTDGEISSDICREVSQVPVSLTTFKSGMFLKQNSPLRTFFNQKIILMMEIGLQRRYIKYYIKKTTVRCSESSGNVQVVPMTFRDVWSAFILLIAGVIFSILTLLLERQRWSRCKY